MYIAAGGGADDNHRLCTYKYRLDRCSLSEVKRTAVVLNAMSAYDPFRTLAACDQGHSAKAAI